MFPAPLWAFACLEGKNVILTIASHPWGVSRDVKRSSYRERWFEGVRDPKSADSGSSLKTGEEIQAIHAISVCGCQQKKKPGTEKGHTCEMFSFLSVAVAFTPLCVLMGCAWRGCTCRTHLCDTTQVRTPGTRVRCASVCVCIQTDQERP